MSNELTLENSQPVELYEFVSDFQSYYYTSDNKTWVVDSKTYLPINLRRSSIKIGSHKDEKDEVEIEVPVDVDVAIAWAFSQSPPSLEVTIKRIDRANTTSYTMWKGPVSIIKIKGYFAIFKCPTRFTSILSSSVPVVQIQWQCNHTLFDDMCGVDRSSYSYTTTISSISSDGLTIGLASAGTGSNADYVGGEFLNTDTGERRTIVSKTGTSINLNYPMTQSVSDNVEVTQGCDHSWGPLSPQGCAKFSNLPNYGGFFSVPGEDRNFFQTGF